MYSTACALAACTACTAASISSGMSILGARIVGTVGGEALFCALAALEPAGSSVPIACPPCSLTRVQSPRRPPNPREGDSGERGGSTAGGNRDGSRCPLVVAISAPRNAPPTLMGDTGSFTLCVPAAGAAVTVVQNHVSAGGSDRRTSAASAHHAAAAPSAPFRQRSVPCVPRRTPSWMRNASCEPQVGEGGADDGGRWRGGEHTGRTGRPP